MPFITPFLWFNDNKAEEAVDFYLSVFKSGRKIDTVTSAVEPFKKDQPVTISFELDGQHYTAFNGVGARFEFNEAISLVVHCKDQSEIDYYWSALLADGGSEMACGWLKDRYGLRWQICPDNIGELINSPGGMKAMMGMIKLDVAALEQANRSQ